MGRNHGPGAVVSAPEPELALFLQEAGLAGPGEQGDWTPLAGGVSSDIWRVTLTSGDWCVKRALSQLKVAADWKAPVDRNAFEWAYMQVAAEIAPGSVPRPVAHDPHRGLFAMTWLAPDEHRLWKTELLAGHVDPRDAAAVGGLLGTIHSATSRDRSIPQRFATDANFHALRIEPYLVATAEKHPAVADRIYEIAKRTAATRRALVHGDVSPKNIMLGPHGPVLLDAECAWFGDPAFDIAFCLNHLVIKTRIAGEARLPLDTSFDRLWEAYSPSVDWEPVGELEQRAALLLPALALARVDGKSPLDYLSVADGDSLRSVAVRAISAQLPTLAEAKSALLR